MTSKQARSADMDHTAGRGLMLVMLVLAAMINSADRGILSLATPAIKAEFHFSDSELGLLGGLSFGVFYGLAALPIGYIAMRANRRSLLVACMVFWSCSTALTGLARGFGSLFVARSAVGMGEAGGLPLSLSLIASRYDVHERAAASGWITAGQSFGGIVGAWITGWLIASAGWRSAFFVLGMPGLLLALVLWTTVAEPRLPSAEPVRLGTVLQVWRRPLMRELTIVFVLTSIVAYGSFSWMPSFFARQFHLGAAAIGLLSGVVVGFGNLAGALSAGQIVHHRGRSRAGFAMDVAGWISLMAVPAGIIGSFTTNLPLAVVMMAIASFASGARTALFYAAAQNSADHDTRPMVIAILASLTVLVGSSVGPVLIGVISDHAPGGIATALACSFALPITIVFYCWSIARRLRAEDEASAA
ncbi:MFS transporter [Novosphingobium sp.]|uniref:MFS transporter n=1 Tax=Novosphingobium sp. TaxID=1874826 RepID=UPI003340F186